MKYHSVGSYTSFQMKGNEENNLPRYGIKYYEIKRGNRNEKIGFFYPEVVINILEDAGSKGRSVREIRIETELGEKTIRNILIKLTKMKRITRRQVPSSSKLPNYKYYITRKWMNVL